MTDIEERKFVVQSPGRIEHLAVRKRDWKTIYDSLGQCEPPLTWTSALGWSAVGAGVGGVFSWIGIKDTDASPLLKSATGVAAICLVVLGVVCLIISREIAKATTKMVDRIRTQMDDIAAESDREEGF